MSKAKIIEWVDIKAPLREVFELVINLERRMQLSPLWGIAQIQRIAPEYPQPGSCYAVRVSGDQEIQYETAITAYEPPHKFCYALDVRRKSCVTWTFQEVAQGTRVIYLEEFLLDDDESDDFDEKVRQVVKKWLENIKRYAELGDRWLERLIKWVLDRFFLKLRQEQRRTVLIVLFLHITGLITFIFAAVAIGIAYSLQ
jgi:hypothetical protein